MVGSPIAKVLIGLGIAGTSVTSVVLISPKNKQNSGVNKSPSIEDMVSSSSKIHENCGNYENDWNVYDYSTSSTKKYVKNTKNKNKLEYEECFKQYKVQFHR